MLWFGLCVRIILCEHLSPKFLGVLSDPSGSRYLSNVGPALRYLRSERLRVVTVVVLREDAALVVRWRNSVARFLVPSSQLNGRNMIELGAFEFPEGLAACCAFAATRLLVEILSTVWLMLQ